MSHYFNLELFVHALQFADPAFVEATLGLPESTHFPNIPYAIAASFLDYPLILIYAKQGALDTSAYADSFPAIYDGITFDSGKSCMLQADLEELQFLVEQTPLYVSLFHVKTLPKPTMLAAGHTAILVSPAPGPGQPTSNNATIRKITLFSPAGLEVGVLHLSCRLTHYGPRVPPLSTFTILPQQPPRSVTNAPVVPTATTGVTSNPPQTSKPPVHHSAQAAQVAAAELRQQRQTAAAAVHRPPQPPALFFANDPLNAQQPQAFLQRAQEQVARQREVFVTGEAAGARTTEMDLYRQQQQRPRRQWRQPTTSEVAASQAEYEAARLREAQYEEESDVQYEEDEDEEDEEEEETSAAWVAAPPMADGVLRRRRRWNDDTLRPPPKPGQALLEALFMPSSSFRPAALRPHTAGGGGTASRSTSAGVDRPKRGHHPATGAYKSLLSLRDVITGRAVAASPTQRPTSAPGGKARTAAPSAVPPSSNRPNPQVAATPGPQRMAWADSSGEANMTSRPQQQPSKAAATNSASHPRPRSKSPGRVGKAGTTPTRIPPYRPQHMQSPPPGAKAPSRFGGRPSTPSTAAKHTVPAGSAGGRPPSAGRRSQASTPARRRVASPPKRGTATSQPGQQTKKQKQAESQPSNKQLAFSDRKPSPGKSLRRPSPTRPRGPARMASEATQTEDLVAAAQANMGDAAYLTKMMSEGIEEEGDRHSQGHAESWTREGLEASVARSEGTDGYSDDVDEAPQSPQRLPRRHDAPPRYAAAAAAADVKDSGVAAAAAAAAVAGPGGPVYQMTSVMMWEVMSLVTMRTVLSQAISAIGGQMSGMASQLAAQAAAQAMQQVQPVFMQTGAGLGAVPGTPGPGATAAAAAAPGMPPYLMTPQMLANMPPGMPIFVPPQQQALGATQPYPQPAWAPAAAGQQTPPAQYYMPGWAAGPMGQQTPPPTAGVPYAQQYEQQGLQQQAQQQQQGSNGPDTARGGSGLGDGSGDTSTGPSGAGDRATNLSKRSSVSSVPSGTRNLSKLQSYVVRPAPPKPPPPQAPAAGSAPPSAPSTEYSDLFSSEPSSAALTQPVAPAPRRRVSDAVTEEVASEEEGSPGVHPFRDQRCTSLGWIKEELRQKEALLKQRSSEAYSEVYEDDFEDEGTLRPQAAPAIKRKMSTTSRTVDVDESILMDVDEEEQVGGKLQLERPSGSFSGGVSGGVARGPLSSLGRTTASISGEESLAGAASVAAGAATGSGAYNRRLGRLQSRVAFQVPENDELRAHHSNSTISISEESELGPLPNLGGRLQLGVTTQEVQAVNPEETMDDMDDLDDLLGTTDIRASVNSNISAVAPVRTFSRNGLAAAATPQRPASMHLEKQESKASSKYSALFSSVSDVDDDAPAPAAQPSRPTHPASAPTPGRAARPSVSSSLHSDDSDFLSDNGKKAKAEARARAEQQAAAAAAGANKAKINTQTAASSSSSSLFSSSSSLSTNATTINILGSNEGRVAPSSRVGSGGGAGAAGGGGGKRSLLRQSSSVRRPDSELPSASQRRSKLNSGLSFSIEGLEIEHSTEEVSAGGSSDMYEPDFDDADLEGDLEVGVSAVGVPPPARADGRPQSRYGAPGASGAGTTSRLAAVRDVSLGETQELEEALANLSSDDDDKHDDRRRRGFGGGYGGSGGVRAGGGYGGSSGGGYGYGSGYGGRGRYGGFY